MHTLPTPPPSASATPLTAVEVSLMSLDHHTHRAAVSLMERRALEDLIAVDWALARMTTESGPCR